MVTLPSNKSDWFIWACSQLSMKICVVPENAHTCPMEGFFSLTPSLTPLEIPAGLYNIL